MKKIIALSLALAFVLSTTGCGNSKENESLEKSTSTSAIHTTELITKKVTTTIKTTEAEEINFYYDGVYEDLTFSIRDDYNVVSDGVWAKESGNGFSFVSMPNAFSGDDVISAKQALAVYASIDDMEIKEWTEVNGQQAVISVSSDSINLLFFVGTKMYILVCQNMEEKEVNRLIDSIKIDESALKSQTESPTEKMTYSEGTYKVGTDIPAGEYCIYCTSSVSGYYSVSADSKGDSIIGNENFDYNAFVTISDGQYLELSRSMAIPVSAIDGVSYKIDTSKTGMFRVGIDIPAGEYKLLNDSEFGGYYCVYNSSNPDADIVTNDNFEGQAYVTVSDGQYLLLSRCKIE